MVRNMPKRGGREGWKGDSVRCVRALTPQKARSVRSYESVRSGAARQSAEPAKTSCRIAAGESVCESAWKPCEPAIFESMKIEKTSPWPIVGRSEPEPIIERRSSAGVHRKTKTYSAASYSELT